MANYNKYIITALMLVFFFAVCGVKSNRALAAPKESWGVKFELGEFEGAYKQLLALRQHLRSLDDYSEYGVTDLLVLRSLIDSVNTAFETTTRIYEPMVYFNKNRSNLDAYSGLMLLEFISSVRNEIIPLLKITFGRVKSMANEEPDVFLTENNIFLSQYQTLDDALTQVLSALEGLSVKHESK